MTVAEPPPRPLVKTHPETGAKALAIGRHACGIPGIAEEESEALLAGLVEAACRPPAPWTHSWTPGDAVGLGQPAPAPPERCPGT